MRFLIVLLPLLMLAGMMMHAGGMLTEGERPPRPVVTELDESCTIGVACGSVTADGRPLLWKTRDSGTRNNELYLHKTFDHRFLCVINVDEENPRSWMGLNEHGFAILNAYIREASGAAKPDTITSNGVFMRQALGTCRSVTEFEAFLDTTSSYRQIKGIFGVIDTTGAAMMYEVIDKKVWPYNPADTPEGYLIRATFTCHDTVPGGPGPGVGYERFLRSHDLIAGFVAAESLDPHTLMRWHMRDFSDATSKAVPVPFPDKWELDKPFGFINTMWSICRQISVSATVIQGVDPAAEPREPAYLSTMWTMLGSPASAIAVPYWAVGEPPAVASGPGGAPLCWKALRLRDYLFWYDGDPYYIDSYRMRDELGDGLWATTFAVEDSIFSVAEDSLAAWRLQPPSWQRLLAAETELADYAYATLQQYVMTGADEAPPPAPGYLLHPVAPNPFNAGTTIAYTLPTTATVSLEIYDLRGHRVAQLVDRTQRAGDHALNWDADRLPSGTYLVQLTVDRQVFTRRCVLLK